VTARIAEENPRSDRGWGALVEPLQNDFMPKGWRNNNCYRVVVSIRILPALMR
jgi:hypothetical protein